MAWRIIDSQKVQRDFKELCMRARTEGRLHEVLDAMKRVYLDLGGDPLAVGEPHNRLKHLELLLCVVVEQPLVVRFAIDEKRQWVYLRSIELVN